MIANAFESPRQLFLLLIKNSTADGIHIMKTNSRAFANDGIVSLLFGDNQYATAP